MASTCKNSRVIFGSVLQDHENSGTATPPLWKTTHYGNLSPKSRSEAIERGQKELMEMVSNMPEGCYELSLRDIVEVQHQQEQQHKVTNKTKRSSIEYRKKGVVRRGGSLNNNGGFLLKMVFPISWGCGSKKKKKNGSFSSNSAVSSSSRDGRVSPKPLLSEGSMKCGSGGGGGGDDKQWWVGRRFSESEGSSGGFSSVNSGSAKSSGSGSSNSRCSSMNSSRIRHGNGGCWCFTFKTKE